MVQGPRFLLEQLLELANHCTLLFVLGGLYLAYWTVAPHYRQHSLLCRTSWTRSKSPSICWL